VLLLLWHRLQNFVQLSTHLVIVVFFELGPVLALFDFLLLFLAQLVQFLGHFASLDESLHLVEILLAHIFRVSWVFGLQEDCEQFEHGFLNRQGWVLQSIFTDLSQGTGNNSAKGLGHEGLAVLLLLKLVQEHWVLRSRHLDWKLYLSVPAGVQEESACLLLRGEHEALVLKADN